MTCFAETVEETRALRFFLQMEEHSMSTFTLFRQTWEWWISQQETSTHLSQNVEIFLWQSVKLFLQLRVFWNGKRRRGLPTLRQIYWDEAEWRLSQMCGGGTGGQTTCPILLQLSSVCAHLAFCVTFSLIWSVGSNCQNFALSYTKVGRRLVELMWWLSM